MPLSICLLVSLLLASLLLAPNAQAKNSNNQSLSPKTYQALNDIQALLAENKYTEVEEGLKDLEENLNPGFGLALTYQTHAQLFLAQEKNTQALSYFNKALALEAMKAVQAVSLATNVAQLYLSDGQIDQAITVLKPRIGAAEQEDEGSTTAMAFITIGSAYQLKQDFNNAIIWLQQGIDRASEPRENWLQMLMAAHYQLKQYRQAVAILDQLIVINENKEEYWLQQASLYQIMNKPKDALKVLQLANVRNILVKEDGLITLVQLLITEGVPERAGRTLLSLLKNKKIEITEDNWQLLASAWLQSRERQLAVQAFVNAAELSLKETNSKLEAAKLYYRVGQIQFDEADYKGAIASFDRAKSLGISDKQVGLSLLMQGNSYFELEDYINAKIFFSKALKEASSTNSARAWLDYMEQLELF
jgi:tetratricopeptide (TPR) repeat protein